MMFRYLRDLLARRRVRQTRRIVAKMLEDIRREDQERQRAVFEAKRELALRAIAENSGARRSS